MKCKHRLLACLAIGVVLGGSRPQGPQAMDGSFGMALDERVSDSVRASFARARNWLLAAQNADGSWGDNAGAPGDLSNTCIAVLALAAEGNTMSRGRHTRQLRRGVEYVLRRVRGYGDDGASLDSNTLIQRKLGPNIDVYLTTVMLSQVMGSMPTREEERTASLVMARMTRAIASFQQTNGAFEVTYEPMLTTVLAWLALRQSNDVGVSVHAASAQKVVKYLKTECLEAATGVFREQRWNNQERFVTQAGALRVLYGMDESRQETTRRGTSRMLAMRFDQDVGGRQGGEEFLGAVFGTQALLLGEDTTFWKWYPKMSQALVSCQNADGSWDGHHCITGRVFCTSCSMLTMLTPARLLPMLHK